MAAQYRCGTARRRAAVRDAAPPTVNGIDYLEVGPDQQTLEVVFLHDLPGGGGSLPVPDAPDLGPGQPTPTCLATVVHGGPVYDNGVLS